MNYGSKRALRVLQCTPVLTLIPLACRKHKTKTESLDIQSEGISPLAPIRIFRPNPNLEIAFDVRTRTPVYVLERLVPQQSTQNSVRRRRHFYEEKSLPEAFRSRNAFYKHSGYDRGHLAPAADFADNVIMDSYNLINVAPQNPDMNRKIWALLEDWARAVAKTSEEYETYVVTGPLWLPKRQVSDKRFEYSYAGLGVPPCLVAVPTHFFKVIVLVDKRPNTNNRPEIQAFACFVVPNRDSNRDLCLQDYLVRWTDLEAVSGLTLFPTLANEEWKATADALTEQLLSASRTVLLLTDGSTAEKSQATNTRVQETTLVQHLCHVNSCVQYHKTKERLLLQQREQ